MDIGPFDDRIWLLEGQQENGNRRMSPAEPRFPYYSMQWEPKRERFLKNSCVEQFDAKLMQL
ncbi:MAG TPA: hypothetical protein H9679_02980 [Firmicutes bacterium]|nr:hypothetical protein [Bacillota bacterium]